MITLTQTQVSNIEQAIAQKFAQRVIAVVDSDYSDLSPLEPSARNEFICKAIDEAKSIYIEIEQDVFDYVLLSLVAGAALLSDERLKQQLQWLQSPYVPSVKKIQRIRGWLND